MPPRQSDEATDAVAEFAPAAIETPGSTPATSPSGPERSTSSGPVKFVPMVRGYWAAIGPESGLAVTTMVWYAISAVAEAAALGMLTPLLGTTAGGGGGAFTDILQTLGFSGRGVIWAAVGGLALLSIVAAVTRFEGDAGTARVRGRVEARLRKELTDRLMAMDWSSFVMLRFGDIASSLMMESSQVGAGVQQLLTVVGSILATATFVVLALLLSPRLTLVVVGFALIGAFVLRPIGRRAEGHTNALTAATTDIALRVAEVLGNLKFFRSTGSYRGTQFAEGYDEYATWFQRTLVSPYVVRLIYELSALGFITAVLAVSLAGKSALSATTVVFLAIFYRLSPRVRDLQAGLVMTTLQYPWLVKWEERSSLAAAYRAELGGSIQPSFSDGIVTTAVSFTFPRTTAEVLDDVSWELRPGESVAFVGESGAGKTTMLDLVSGLLTPTSGQIIVDGVSLSDVDLKAWQSHIGVVLQESPLFHGTVRDNVVGDRTIDDERVWQCLSAAHATGFVEELPNRLDTVIGERGGRLSGGQRQRLGLARALYRRPWLLILDEATSQLDSVSENIVLDALRELRGQVSMMIVAHRLVTVEMADRIYVLERGRIVQSGSWTDLLSDSYGTFARMAAKQGLTSVPA